MRRREIDIDVTSQASPGQVYALLIDGATWTKWSPIEKVRIERRGDGDGVGEIREHTRGRSVGRDQTDEVVPGRRFAYRSLSGLPVRDYRAAVLLDEVGGGTRIRWTASFEPKIHGTGRILERGIGKFLRQCAEGLAEHAVDSTGDR